MATQEQEDLAPPPAPSFAGTDRYEVKRRIGSGSYGVVYEALDRTRGSKVALKWLRYANPDTIFRFKTEFRSLAEISHPHLVTLLNLENEGEEWFFTMELVRGEPVHDYLRPSDEALTNAQASSTVLERRVRRAQWAAAAATQIPGERSAVDVDVREVRQVFRQLALGVHALHEAGKLHRDLKCQNVLVTAAPRVVLLDFGMVRQLGRAHPDGLDVAGTPLYMAPEQCAGAPVGPPADWYAFGVMLFRALTGEMPFVGRMYEVLAAKQTRDGDAPSALVRDVPPELDALCEALLRRDPNDRPDGLAVLLALGGTPQAPVSFPAADAEIFVGRRRQLRALESARRRVREGFATAIYVHGPSGIGKTALVHHFLDRVLADDRDALVLRGRCYERETLPHKALDSVVDDLMQQLTRWSAEECAEIVPRDAQDLVRVFPTLARVEAFREASENASIATDPQEQRRRAVGAFEELLANLAKRRHVVIFMDDLQWGDGDSAQLVRPLLHGPADPAVLWVGTYRTDEAAESAYLSAIQVGGTTDADSVHIEVPELDDEEARTLLELRLSETARSEALLDDLARDAAGSPLLIDLLVRHAREPGRTAPVDLGVVLARRMEELPSSARDLLGVLALRGRPLEVDLAAELAGVEFFDVRMLTVLRNMKLLRGDEVLELFHDRIREAVTSSFSDEFERSLHRRLADGLASRGDADPEALARHYRGAEAWTRAFSYTVAAADRAVQTLAFDRAAALYESALDLHARTSDLTLEPSRQTLRVQRADALRNAGRGVDAAAAYLEAADSASPHRSRELRRLGAEQLLFSGHVDDGRVVLRSILEDLGIRLPEHPVLTLAEFLARRAQVKLRGLGYRERSRTEISDDDIFRIDVCWSISIGLAMIDPVRGGIFQARHLLMALDAGEISRIARAVAVEVPFSATSGLKNNLHTESLIERGQRLAERSGDPYVRGLLASSSGGARWLQGRWSAALELEETALSILREECTGAAWEFASSTIVYLDVLWRMGRLDALLERWPDIMDDAVMRGDLLLEIYCRIKFGALTCLVEGRPNDAIQGAGAALARWTQTGFTLLQLWELFSCAEAHLYAGRPEAAYARVHAQRSSVNRSGLLQLQMYDVTWADLRGRCALSCATRAHGRRKKKLLGEARGCARAIRKSGAPWGRGFASLLEAGAGALAGDGAGARRSLVRADLAFSSADMELHAAVARARHAQLEPSGVNGEAAATDALMRSLGIREPDRWLSLLAPACGAP